MILNDLAQVLYAPQKAFKKIIENPKYLGAVIVLILFIGIQVGYEYSQFSKVYTEQTNPTIDQLSTYTNATLWSAASNVAVTNNFDDYFNYTVYVASFGAPPTNPLGYYSLFGNSSLQLSANNTNTLTAAIGNAFNVDSTPNGFQNLTMIVKQTSPTTAPQNATLTLYSLNDTSYYTLDITPQLSNASTLGQWNNLTFALGPNAPGWTETGTPTWQNITSLKLDITYSANSNVSVQIGGLFFHGQYLTPLQYNSTGLLLEFLQLFGMQFLISWLLITGVIWALCKAFKGAITWKPMFVAVGVALIVLVIRAIVDIAATAIVPTIYYSYDVVLGARFDPFGVLYYPLEATGTLFAQSQTLIAGINAATATFRSIVSGMAVISYVWLAAVLTFAIGAAKPEFGLSKRILISGVSVAVTFVVLLFFIGVV